MTHWQAALCVNRLRRRTFELHALDLGKEHTTLSFGSIGREMARRPNFLSWSAQISLGEFIVKSRALALALKSKYGKEDYGFGEVADCGGQGHSGSSGGPGARPGADQHYGVLQAVQCQDQRQGTRRPDHPGCGVGVQRSHLQLHHQDASGFDSVEARRRRGQGFRYAEQGQGWQGDGKQVLEIAKQKMPDLNAASVEAAVKSVKGT